MVLSIYLRLIDDSSYLESESSFMVNVFLTVDVEIWCDGWLDIDRKFPDAFQRYIIGRTPDGEFGLRYQAQELRKHGLSGVFFVEPMFSGRFGTEPLKEIVGTLREGQQDVQLHLHTEWLDEWATPLLDCSGGKRQFLRQFSLEDQRIVVKDGVRRLHEAGAPTPIAFRAGSFGFNADTLRALVQSGLRLDFSYNAAQSGLESGVAPGAMLTDVSWHDGIIEAPMTVYRTGTGKLRHAQLGACSWREMEALLWQAVERGQSAFVILWHNFELLSPSKTRVDSVVLSRFQRLCAFLAKHKDVFRTSRAEELIAIRPAPQGLPLRGSPWLSFSRSMEQISRRRYM